MKSSDQEDHRDCRLDKWLWAVRLYKTRSLAAQACREGRVMIGGQRVKPARAVHVGEIFTAKTGDLLRTVKVLGAPGSRVSAKLVPDFLEDLTPASEFQKQRERLPAAFTWDQGSGRPTKKDRRLWEKFGTENQ